MNGNSDELTRSYLDRFVIEWRHLEITEATTECELLDAQLKTPIMCGGMAFYEKLNEGGSRLFAEGARMAGTAMWIGMSTEEDLENVIAVGAPSGRIIKPFEDENLVLQAIKHDEQAGAAAFAMDIDHVFKKNGSVDDFFGNKLVVQTRDSLRKYQESTSLPFYPKGVLSVKDAEICAEAGVKGIIVSHHQNMFPWSVPPVKILPEIRKAVGDALEIFVDCGLLSGYDVFKALAFGADAVLVARPLRESFKEGGAQGVADHITRMTDELRAAMARTGSPDIKHINKEAVVKL